MIGALTKHRSGDWQTASHRARLLAVRGDARAAVRVALEGCPAVPEAADCLTRALDFGRVARDVPTLEAIADRYVALRCGSDADCASAHDEVGSKYAEMGVWGFALRHFGAAAKAEPTTNRWIRNAEAAAHVGSAMNARMSIQRALSAADLTAEQRQRIVSIEELLRNKEGL